MVLAAVATAHVLCVRHDFEVVRTDTCTIPTEMVDLHAVWDLTDLDLVGHTVSKQNSAFHLELAVPARLS